MADRSFGAGDFDQSRGHAEYDLPVRLAVAGPVVVGIALFAFAATGAAAPSATVLFQTPSHNIGCIYLSGFGDSDRPYLRCDIGGGLHPLPPRPKGCDLDWGYGYAMSDTDRPKPLCAGDTARDPRAPVLQYGRSWHRGPFTCVSRTSGLRCVSRAKHGFVLSRQRSYTF